MSRYKLFSVVVAIAFVGTAAIVCWDAVDRVARQGPGSAIERFVFFHYLISSTGVVVLFLFLVAFPYFTRAETKTRLLDAIRRRPAVSDREFVERCFRCGDVPAAVMIEVRRIVADQLSLPEELVLPDDDFTDPVDLKTRMALSAMMAHIATEFDVDRKNLPTRISMRSIAIAVTQSVSPADPAVSEAICETPSKLGTP